MRRERGTPFQDKLQYPTDLGQGSRLSWHRVAASRTCLLRSLSQALLLNCRSLLTRAAAYRRTSRSSMAVEPECKEFYPVVFTSSVLRPTWLHC